MMNSADDVRSLVRLLRELFPWIQDNEVITPDQRLREDLQLDSLAMVNLQVTIEDEYRIRFDPIEMDLTGVFDTVGSLADFVRGLLALEESESDR